MVQATQEQIEAAKEAQEQPQTRDFYQELQARTPDGLTGLATKFAVGAYKGLKACVGFYPWMFKTLARGYMLANDAGDALDEAKLDRKYTRTKEDYANEIADPNVDQALTNMGMYFSANGMDPEDYTLSNLSAYFSYLSTIPGTANEITKLGNVLTLERSLYDLEAQKDARFQREIAVGTKDILEMLGNDPKQLYALMQKSRVSKEASTVEKLEKRILESLENRDNQGAIDLAKVLDTLRGNQKSSIEDLLMAQYMQQAQSQGQGTGN